MNDTDFFWSLATTAFHATHVSRELVAREIAGLVWRSSGLLSVDRGGELGTPSASIFISPRTEAFGPTGDDREIILVQQEVLPFEKELASLEASQISDST